MTASPANDAPERYLLIDGRRWRRSDPAIPEKLRAELTAELMSARRAVGAALRDADAAAERRARTRVQDAKIALGERGTAWWQSATPAQLRTRAIATVFALLRHRGPGKTICPSDVARALAGDGFRACMPLVRAIGEELSDAGRVELRQKGVPVEPRSARGPLRLALKE